jgi:hypothetical protein
MPTAKEWLASNRVPAAARLLTLPNHPRLDLVVVFIREGDGAGGRHSGSGLVMEMPGLHRHAPQHAQQTRRGRRQFRNRGGNPQM